MGGWAFLDALLGIVHTSFVLGVLTLWAFERTRRLHLVLVALTALSWFGCGLFRGLGYCFLTDWHWAVKTRLGETGLPGSFIHYALTRWLGLPLAPATTNLLSAVAFGISVLLALGFEWRRRAARRA